MNLVIKGKYLCLFRHFFQERAPQNGLIFVVDANDHSRLEETRDELHRLFNDDMLKSGTTLLVLANKQDLPNAISSMDLTDQLGLHGLPTVIKWHIQACCAVTGDGLSEGLDWLSSALH
jgi:signal recognition particle receptor subunit beta